MWWRDAVIGGMEAWEEKLRDDLEDLEGKVRVVLSYCRLFSAT